MPIGDYLTRNKVTHYIDFYEKSQYWPIEQIISKQNSMLISTINDAYNNIPFYKELWDSANIKPDQISSVADLPKLPIVTKDMLRNEFPNGTTKKTKFPFNDYSTSGSTGSPFTVRIDNDSMSRARALMFLRSMMAGYKPGDSILQTGMSTDRGFLKGLKDKIFNITYCQAFDLSNSVLDNYLEQLISNNCKYVIGYAQSIFLLAKRAEINGCNIQLNGVVSWGSNMLSEYRSKIEPVFGCKVYDSYGVGEGMQIASQCEYGNFHSFALHVVSEICQDGLPVNPGHMGEIVLTRLDAGAMPLIRYRVGDCGTMSSDKTCPCGRNLPILQSIDGRTSDIVSTPSGNKLIVEFFNGIFQYAPTISNFQIIQHSTQSIKVKIVTTDDFTLDDWEKVKNLILEKGDNELIVEMEQVSEIPLEASKKRRYIKSSVPI